MTAAKLPGVGATIWLKIEAEIVPITIDEIDSVCIFGHDPKGRLCSAVTSAEGVNWFRTDPCVKPAEASSTMRERLCAFMAERTVNSAEEWGLALWISDVVEWCESEVRLALAPRDPSPEFEAAEVALHICVDSLQRAKPELHLHRRRCKPIADELDRRAAALARLRAITEHCRECGISFSERAEMADTGLCDLCEGERDAELTRLREFARKVREAERLSMGPSEYANRISEALDELAAPTKETT